MYLKISIFEVTKQQISERDQLIKLGRSHKVSVVNLKFILLSDITHEGLDHILSFMEKGKTYCVVGSSGVGKSTLINNLCYH